MNPIPDLSVFSCQDFINQMIRIDRPSCLMLYSGVPAEPEILFGDQEKDILSKIHDITGKMLDFYLPFPDPSSEFYWKNRQHIAKLLLPVKRALKRLSGEGLDEIYQPFILNSFMLSASYQACSEISEILPELSGIPLLIYWSSLKGNRVQIIHLDREEFSTDEFLRTLSKIVDIGNTGKKWSDFSKEVKVDLDVSDYLRVIGEIYSNIVENSVAEFYENENNQAAGNSERVRWTEAKKRELEGELRKAGFASIRNTGGHDIWKHPKLSKVTPLPRHPSISAFVSGSIRRDIIAAQNLMLG